MAKSDRSFIDKSIDFVFSRDERKWLFLIVILGFILRMIVASNVVPVADESGSIAHAIGVSKLAPLSQLAQAQVWYYLTDYSFRIFGVSLLTGRLLSVVFGTLTIILVYLIASLLFNKKTGLVAAFLLAVSAFHITWAASYQDETMMFFVLLASYFFIKEYMKTGKISIFAAVFLAISELVKIITGVFVLVFMAFILGILIKNFRKDKKLFKENLTRAIIFVVILALAMTPILAYNYFLYKEKGIVDLPFAQFLRINAEFYTGPGLAHGEGFVLNKLPRNLFVVLTLYFLNEDPLLFALGFLGIILLFTKLRRGEKRFGKGFLLATFFFALLFIASAIVLQTHYTSFFPYFSIFGATFVVFISGKFEKLKKYSKYIIVAVLLIVLIFNIYHMRGPLTSQSGTQKVRDYADTSIDQNTLVVMDSRIYRATLIWMVHDKNYVESAFFPQIIFSANQPGAQIAPVKTVFVECVADDCGWGVINSQPELNQSTEEMIAFFKTLSVPKEFSGGGWIEGVRGTEENIGQPIYKVYETMLNLDTRIFASLKDTHNHFYYHIPRDEFPEQAFDNYSVNGLVDNTLNVFAYFILYVIIILAVISMAIPFYLLFSERYGIASA